MNGLKSLRDHRLGVALLMLLAAILSWCQAGREVAISDWSWTTENAYRITQGLVPYIDFWIVATPGTYYVQALLMLIFGYSATVQFVFVAVCAALSVLLSFSIVSRVVLDENFALILCVPLVLCSYVIFPYPWQDNDAVLALLVAIYLFLRCMDRQFPWGESFFLGVALSVPFFFKQNIGGLSAVATSIILCAFLKWRPPGFCFKKWIVIVLGGITPFLAFLGYLYVVGGVEGLNEFFYWVFENARRLKKGRDSSIFLRFMAVYSTGGLLPHLLCLGGLAAIAKWKSIRHLDVILIPVTLFVYVQPLADTFLRTFFGSTPLSCNWLPLFIALTVFWIWDLYKGDKFDHRSLLFLFVPLTCHGAFMSQGSLWSSFGVWPLFIIGLAYLYRFLHRLWPNLPLKRWFVIYTVCLTVILVDHNLQNERFFFIAEHRSQPTVVSKHERLSGLGAPGAFFTDMDEVYRVVEERVPRDELIIPFPGEDPFYFATGRTPVLPYSYQCSLAINYPTSWRLEEALERDVKWVLVKIEPQIKNCFDRPDKKTRELLKKHFEINAVFRNYILFKRR